MVAIFFRSLILLSLLAFFCGGEAAAEKELKHTAPSGLEYKPPIFFGGFFYHRSFIMLVFSNL
jgi:hypothetical protein